MQLSNFIKYKEQKGWFIDLEEESGGRDLKKGSFD